MAQRRVNVYLFVAENAPDNPLLPDGNPLGLFPVSRMVNAAAPARPSLLALIAGPTAEEKNHGILSLSVGHFKINVLTIRNGEARVDFTASPGAAWPGDLAPARFRQAVEATLLQFSTVDSVRLSVNGDEDFDSGQG